jgi:DNA modification methylase
MTDTQLPPQTPPHPPALVFLPKQYWNRRRFVLAEWNPREMGEEEYAELKRGVKHFGLLGGLDAREEDGLLIGGHQRYRAACELIDEAMQTLTGGALAAELERMNLPDGAIPVNPIRGLTDAAAAQLNVRLNNAEAQGRWNVPKLTEILSELDARGQDATLTGFDEDRIREMIHDADEQRRQDDDEDEIAMPEEPASRAGELYLLGSHRLICGDATDPATWERLLEGAKADLLFTDPPYGVAYVGGTKKKLTIKNDDITPEQLRELLARSLSLAWLHTKPGAAWYVCAPGGPLFTVFGLVLLALGTWRQTIQWVKDRFVLSRGDYHNRNEPIFAGDRPDLQDPDVPATDELQVVLAESIAYGWKEGAAHRRLEDRTQDNVWEIPRPSRNEEHPTMKPLELVRRAIRNSSRPRALVVDCFAGSGQTLLASDQLGRCAYVIELDPRYCDVIRRRYAVRTGQLHLAPENAGTGAEEAA